MHSHLLNYFCSSWVQFGRYVCFSCTPKVPTKNWDQRITVVSLQSFNDFHRTFLDYIGNCYKHFLMPLSSTRLKKYLFFLIFSHCWSVTYLSVYFLDAMSCNLVPWPRHDSCSNGFGWGCCIYSPKETYYLAPCLLYVCCSWLRTSWQVALSILLGKRSWERLVLHRWTALCYWHLLRKRTNIAALNLQTSCI